MKILLLFIVGFATHYTFGQLPKVATIKQANPITKEAYTFPKIIAPNSSMAARKINNKVRECVLGISQITKDANIFDSVWRTNYRMENISNLSFKVCEVSASLISLTISGEGCGAYCEAFNYHFTFNAKTGNQLTLNSLFTHQGLVTFLKTLNDNKRKKLKNKLKQINQLLSLPNVKKEAAEKERLSLMLSMYTDCLTNKIDIQFASDIQISIKAGMITVYTKKCSVHYNMAFDELQTFIYREALKNLRKNLNEFGASLITN